MLYSRSFLLLTGLPAVLCFGTFLGTAPFMDDASLEIEASEEVRRNVTAYYPDDVCSKLGEKVVIIPDDKKVVFNEKTQRDELLDIYWCGSEYPVGAGRPTKETCNMGNRLKLGKKTLTRMGEARIYDICAWDDHKQKCVLADSSYQCLETCPNVPVLTNFERGMGSRAGCEDQFSPEVCALEGAGPNFEPRTAGSTHTYIVTECSLKTPKSVNQWIWEGNGKYSNKWTYPDDQTCVQKLVRCGKDQKFLTPWDDAVCDPYGSQTGTRKDGCCYTPNSRARRGLKEETKLEPREDRRRLTYYDRNEIVCPGGQMHEMDNKNICCDGTGVTFPEQKYFEAFPDLRGFHAGNPQLAEFKEQFAITETCTYKGGNTCTCTNAKVREAGDTPTCLRSKPCVWGTSCGYEA